MKLKLLAVAIGTALLSGCSLFQNPLRDYIGVWEIKKTKDTYCYVMGIRAPTIIVVRPWCSLV